MTADTQLIQLIWQIDCASEFVFVWYWTAALFFLKKVKVAMNSKIEYVL